jgi:hypothetical protein
MGEQYGNKLAPSDQSSPLEPKFTPGGQLDPWGEIKNWPRFPIASIKICFRVPILQVMHLTFVINWALSLKGRGGHRLSSLYRARTSSVF